MEGWKKETSEIRSLLDSSNDETTPTQKRKHNIELHLSDVSISRTGSHTQTSCVTEEMETKTQTITSQTLSSELTNSTESFSDNENEQQNAIEKKQDVCKIIYIC